MFNEVLEEQVLRLKYIMNKIKYDKRYYLPNCIYPNVPK